MAAPAWASLLALEAENRHRSRFQAATVSGRGQQRARCAADLDRCHRRLPRQMRVMGGDGAGQAGDGGAFGL